MIAASDSSVELSNGRKTVRVTDGNRLVRTLRRYHMEPWTEGDLSVRRVYDLADGGPSGHGGAVGHWLWIDITVGVIPKHFDPTATRPNPSMAGKPSVDHIVLANSSAAYLGTKLREALRRLVR
jgi:hypothetical protein